MRKFPCFTLTRSLQGSANRASLLALATVFQGVAFAQVHVAWQTEDPIPGYGGTQTTDLALAGSGSLLVAGFVPTQSGFGTPGLRLTRLYPQGTVAWESVIPLALADAPFVRSSPVDDGAVIAANYYDFPQHRYKVQIVKVASSGSIAWTSTQPTLDAYTDIRAPKSTLGIDALGNVFFGGSASTGAPSEPRIVSYDAAGNVRFSTPIPLTLGSPTTAATVDVLVLDKVTGDVFAAGHSSFSAAAGFVAYVARMSATGSLNWVRESAAPGGEYVWATDLDVDGAGRASVLLQYSTSDSQTGTVRTSVVRHDPLGVPAAPLDFSATAKRPLALDVDVAGGIVLSGYTIGAVFPAWIARFDASLNLAWERTFTLLGATSHALTSVSIDANGDTTASGNRIGSPSVDLGALSARFDAAGTVRWIDNHFDEFGSNGRNEYAVAHAVDASGRAIVAVRQYQVAASSYPSRQITYALEPQSYSFCQGDGSSSACPCGNNSTPSQQAGCMNSTGNAGKLVDVGVASLVADTLVFTSSGMDANTIALLADGSSANAPFAFGDGLLCVGGSILRLYITAASAGTVVWPPSGFPSISIRASLLGGPVGPGSKRTYQSYYRDAPPGFCTSATFNVSNALLVSWSP